MTTSSTQKQNADCPYRIIDNLAQLGEKNIILTSHMYQENAKELANRNDAALLIKSDQEVQDVSLYLGGIPLILLDFPHFSDGRAYSKAVQLRQEYKFEGEIRAYGDVRQDQLLEMQRCGFDSYVLAQTEVKYFLSKSAKNFSHQYQASILNPNPLFRSRSA
jgi:uncharacterized protein (DUF934 family)